MRAISVIAAVVAPVLAGALISLALINRAASERTTEPRSGPAPVQCMNEMTREKVRTIALAAVDQALKNQVTHLWEVWMKDPKGQPKRAQDGMRIAINAYVRSYGDAQAWLPPICRD